MIKRPLLDSNVPLDSVFCDSMQDSLWDVILFEHPFYHTHSLKSDDFPIKTNFGKTSKGNDRRFRPSKRTSGKDISSQLS